MRVCQGWHQGVSWLGPEALGPGLGEIMAGAFAEIVVGGLCLLL